MTDKALAANDLEKLAARVESATAEEARNLIIAAFDAIHPDFHETIEEIQGRNLGRFFAYLDAGAFLDAATTLVPKGAMWSVGSNGCAIVHGNGALGMSPRDIDGPNAANAALALAAAALRAHSGER